MYAAAVAFDVVVLVVAVGYLLFDLLALCGGAKARFVTDVSVGFSLSIVYTSIFCRRMQMAEERRPVLVRHRLRGPRELGTVRHFSRATPPHRIINIISP